MLGRRKATRRLVRGKASGFRIEIAQFHIKDDLAQALTFSHGFPRASIQNLSRRLGPPLQLCSPFRRIPSQGSFGPRIYCVSAQRKRRGAFRISIAIGQTLRLAYDHCHWSDRKTHDRGMSKPHLAVLTKFSCGQEQPTTRRSRQHSRFPVAQRT